MQGEDDDGLRDLRGLEQPSDKVRKMGCWRKLEGRQDGSILAILGEWRVRGRVRWGEDAEWEVDSWLEENHR